MQDSSVEDSTLQLVVDQLEELVVTIIEEVRERPGVAFAFAAALLGALVGAAFAANRSRRRTSPPARAVRQARQVGELAELAGLGIRLLQNPIVRGLILTAVERQMKRRLAR